MAHSFLFSTITYIYSRFVSHMSNETDIVILEIALTLVFLAFRVAFRPFFEYKIHGLSTDRYTNIKLY